MKSLKPNANPFDYIEVQLTIKMTNTEKNKNPSNSQPPKPDPQPAYNTVSSVPNSPAFIRNKNHLKLNNVLNLDNLVIPPSPSPSLNIIRPVYNVREFNENYIPNEDQKTTKEKFRKFKPDFSRKAWISRLKRFFPIIEWLPSYDIKQNLIADIIVGITIASFQVPQSMSQKN